MRNSKRCVETSDEWIVIAHRHQGAPHRRGGRAHQRPRRQGGAGRDGKRRHHRRRDRPDHRRHGHAGHVFPEHRLLRADEDRGEKCRVFRRERGLRRLPLRARNRPAVHHFAHLRHDPRHRRGEAFEHRRLDRIAIPACSSATAPARPSCGIAAAATASSRPSWRATAASPTSSTFPAAARRFPINKDNADQRLNCIKMNGKETYKHAVTSMLDAAQKRPRRRESQARGPRLHHPASGQSAHHRSHRRPA